MPLLDPQLGRVQHRKEQGWYRVQNAEHLPQAGISTNIGSANLLPQWAGMRRHRWSKQVGDDSNWFCIERCLSRVQPSPKFGRSCLALNLERIDIKYADFGFNTLPSATSP